MGISCWICCGFLLYLALFLTPFPILVTAQMPRPHSYQIANSSTSWTNSLSSTPDSLKLGDGSFVRIIYTTIFYYHTETEYVYCSCGFIYNRTCNSSLFAIFSYFYENSYGIHEYVSPEILCSAYPKNPTLVLGQKLVPMKQLTSQGGLFSLSLTSQGLLAYINSNPPQPYFYYEANNLLNISYFKFEDKRLAFFEADLVPYAIGQLFFRSSLYMRLGPDRHLRVFDAQWKQVSDVLTPYIVDCGYPTFCGNYGVCTNNQCTCPAPINGTSYFLKVNEKRPELGCSLVTPLSCEASKNQVLLEFENITYLPLAKYPPDVNIDHRSISLESYKEACLKDCSCRAAIFNSSNRVGSCYLQSQIFSVMSADERPELYFKVYIKVQNVPPRKRKHQLN
ncbi:hypothetical protein CFP56_004843 [Quercus suber]|uniref:Receptor kinase n=1 Tax=Quercus suber TaxID=58331 RepID=A0AAW0M8V8_QUESU